MDQPAPDHDERGKPDIGLGFAAAGREKQEIDRLPIGMRWLDQPVQVEQNER
jgi:hypothetical protein